MKTALMIAAAAAAFTLAGSVSAANLLVNGNFEATGFGGTTSYYNLGNAGADHPIPADFGWSVPINNVDIISYLSYGPAPTNGGAYGLDLVGYGSTGEISQTINTVANETYNVSFVYEGNGGVANTAAVLVDNVSIGTVTGSNTWQTFTGSFVGTGGSQTFALNELTGGNNGGVFLDNVSVSGAVPDPAAWTLMLVGFGGLGAVMRGRRRATFAA